MRTRARSSVGAVLHVRYSTFTPRLQRGYSAVTGQKHALPHHTAPWRRALPQMHASTPTYMQQPSTRWDGACAWSIFVFWDLGVTRASVFGLGLGLIVSVGSWVRRVLGGRAVVVVACDGIRTCLFCFVLVPRTIWCSMGH